ncbi:hypothetical protein H7F15_15985 [Pontibacter sp. Tf4]|uniref:hypothetical protein n=1 Tax=Pontibacter sp. Tf4 TaxID=2761620 RepID=UPI001625E52D|nr:hypothetical protein [Pontibacter sp. Tf4]MBB6612546.1 hypothetical protein [Pontibacter sp. Tf4]
MSLRFLPVSALVAFLCLPAIVQAQSGQADTGFLQQSVSGAIKSYQQTIGMQALLYNGSEYRVQVRPHIEGNQYYDAKTFVEGNVAYDGALYSSVPLLYDVELDEVITIHPVSGLSQKLVKEKVSGFEIGKHTFIRIAVDSAAKASLKPGFYSLLYDGETKALHRREKVLQERVTNNGYEGEYKTTDRFYLLKDGVYYPVKSKGSVLNVLRDQKKELNKFIRENSIRFKYQRESALAKIAAHYDSLEANTGE